MIAGLSRKETMDIQVQRVPIGAQISLLVLIAATFFFGLFSDIPVTFLTPTVQGLTSAFGGGM